MRQRVLCRCCANYFVSRFTTDFIDTIRFIDNTVNIIIIIIIIIILPGPKERIAAMRSGEKTTAAVS